MDYSSANSRDVNISLGTAVTTWPDRRGVVDDAIGDDFSSIENIVGTKFNDWLAGGAGDNLLDGRRGNDWIVGGCGEDTLFGGKGTDKLFGGAGEDPAGEWHTVAPRQDNRLDAARRRRGYGLPVGQPPGGARGGGTSDRTLSQHSPA